MSHTLSRASCTVAETCHHHQEVPMSLDMMSCSAVTDALSDLFGELDQLP